MGKGRVLGEELFRVSKLGATVLGSILGSPNP